MLRSRVIPAGPGRGVLLGALGTVFVVHAVLALTGWANTSSAAIRITDVLYTAASALAALVVAQRAFQQSNERAAWWWLAAGLGCNAIGNVVWDVFYLFDPDAPVPSAADVIWLAYYPCTYVALALLVRSRVRRLPRVVALDGIIGALSLAALVAAIVVGPVVGATDGDLPRVITTIAFPVGDCVMLALCGAAISVLGDRADRMWLLLVGGLVAYAIADCVYAALTSQGNYVDGGPVDILWVAGATLTALAALVPYRAVAEDRESLTGAYAIPAIFSVIAFGVLVTGAAGHSVPMPAIILAAAADAVAAVRISGVVREIESLADSRRLAEIDELTGMLNRRGLIARLEESLADVRATQQPLSLMLFDLDRFKEINDALGHAAGDELLVTTAKRLRAALPDAQLARLGGDEFVALVRCSSDEAFDRARDARRQLEATTDLGGVATHIAASVGIAASPEHGGRRADLLRFADVAMYEAKQQPMGVQVYSSEGDRDALGRLSLVTELREALTEGTGLTLRYQPQVRMDTGEINAVEALVRWEHPVHGLLSPDRFIDLAEQHGLIHMLTLVVLRNSLSQQRHWRDTDVHLDVAVNISAADLMDSDFPDELAALLTEYQTPPGTLVLELTESAVMREHSRVMDNVTRIGELGVLLSLDDFGTGFSSLAHLKRLPVAELKIDKSFVMDMLRDRDSAVIVRSVIELGRALELNVIGEGVETIGHREQLRGLGCQIVQGYLYTKPLAADELTAWLAARPPAPPPFLAGLSSPLPSPAG